MPDVREEEEDDDVVDDLPPIGRLEDDEEGIEGLDPSATIDADGPETLGLDDSTGLDDPELFQLELPTDEAVEDEDFDPIPIGEEIDGGEEYGWTDEAASHAEESWDPNELGMPELADLGRDEDGGAEGVEEVFDHAGHDDDAVPGLPPLLGDLDADEDEGIDLDLGLPETEDEVVLPPLLEGVRVEIVVEQPVVDVAVAGGAIWAASPDGLFRDGVRLAAEGLAGSPVSIGVGEGWVLVGTSDGTFRSTDGGARFALVEALAGGSHFLVEASGIVWSRGPTGRLQRSDDGGVTWSPPLLLTKVAAFATPGRGVVTLSAPEAARAQIAASEDGGARWAAADAPPFEREVGVRCDLAACGDRIAIASAADPGGPFLSRDRGRTWLRVPGLPTTSAVALRDEEGLEIFAAHPLPDGTTIARHVPDQDLASGALAEGVGSVHRLLVFEGGLLAATDGGLLRITLAGPE
ncbi:MAG: exo-alpha-sialidase [Myxococcales bacterium]|nr:exo-alpha-sialidase [Myxococcales bacterium]